jgi:hypothetical protein
VIFLLGEGALEARLVEEKDCNRSESSERYEFTAERRLTVRSGLIIDLVDCTKEFKLESSL